MLSLIWPLVTLSALLLLALLFLIWLLVSQMRRTSQTQQTMLQQTLSATSMTLVEQAKQSREALTEQTAKTLGAVVALSEKSIRGISSIAEQQAKTTDALVPLLAAKDPIAYSQIRQTDVVLSQDGGTDPYPAADDAEWHRVASEAEKAKREQATQLEQEGREWLAQNGVNVDALGFPSADQAGQ